jgi:hypothetical protein
MARSEDTINRITTGYLDTVNDAAPGQNASGVGVLDYAGDLGKVISFKNNNVPASAHTFYGGQYQYVQTKAASSAAPAYGAIAYWYDEATYVVTPDYPAGSSKIAGIYLGAPTKGNYCFIQRSGLAHVLFRASITKATPAIGDLVVVTAGAATADVLADATNLTSVELRSVLGVASEAPANGVTKLVQLWERFFNN